MRIVMIVAGLLVTALAVLVALAWSPDLPLDRLKARWAPAPSKFIVVDGIEVHVRDEGPADDPHPIVLLHGTSSSLHTWDGWVAALKTRHRVIRFDLPGAGLTGGFADGDYATAHYTRFAAAVLDNLRVRHATVAGNSRGGEVAWELSLARPDQVDRLVLIDARGYPAVAGATPLAFRIAQIPLVGPLLFTHITPRSVVAKSLAQSYGRPERVTDLTVERYHDLARRPGNRKALLLQMQQEAYIDADRIRVIHAPTLILWGGQDHNVPVSDAQKFHRDIAGSRLVVLPDVGHAPQEEDPVGSVAAFLAFLRSDPQPASAP